MTSNINPNYPIPGLDQSSKGFRDNFAIIKREIETLQGTTIQLVGGVVSNAVEIGSAENILLATSINGGNISLPEPNYAIQYNDFGTLTGSTNLIYDPLTSRVGINNPSPVATLDIVGDIKAFDRILMRPSTPADVLRVELFHTGNSLLLLNDDLDCMVGTNSPVPLKLMTNQEPHVTITADGFVGIGTTLPLTKFEVFSQYIDAAHFTTHDTLTDSMVRCTTVGDLSTIGIGLEHKIGNQLGGIRIDQDGVVSIHSGEDFGATLSTSTARISIDQFGKVGVGQSAPAYNLEVNGTFKSKGITDTSDDVLKRVGINKDIPDYELDIVGDIATSGAVVSTIPYLSADTSPAVIDTFPTDMYRSAKYFMQVINGSAPNETVNIIDFMVTYVNSVAYLKVIDTFNNGPLGSLGSISVQYSTGIVEIIYTGLNAGNKVTISKTYLLN